MRWFFRVLGLLLLLAYAYVLAHHATLLPQLPSPWAAGVASERALVGLLLVYGLPLAGIACLLAPRWLKWWFSPRTPPLYDYGLGESFWYVVGCALLAVGIGLALLFR